MSSEEILRNFVVGGIFSIYFPVVLGAIFGCCMGWFLGSCLSMIVGARDFNEMLYRAVPAIVCAAMCIMLMVPLEFLYVPLCFPLFPLLTVLFGCVLTIAFRKEEELPK